jgi:hypothetical protein
MSAHLRVPFLTSVVLLLVVACANSTTFTSTWKAPDVTAVTPVGKTIVAVFVGNDEGTRRAAEDQMAADLTARGARGIAGYTILPTPPDAQHLNSEAARAALDKAGANAVVTMRVVSKDQRITITPGTTMPAGYRGFGPYWGSGWGTVYQSGSIRTDTDVSVETLIYALKAGQPDKLLWASTSRTTNPNNLTGLINEVAAATASEMARQGFLASSATR